MRCRLFFFLLVTLTASVARMSLLCVLLVFVSFTSTLVVVPAPSAVARASTSPNCAFPILSTLGAFL